MTDDELLALARRATPGKWREGSHNVWQDDLLVCICSMGNGVRYTYENGKRVYVAVGDPGTSQEDAAFIAAAHPAAIIALIERHRAEVERLTREGDKALHIAREKENQPVAANLDAADLSKKQRYANHYEEQIGFLVERFAEALSSKLRKAEEKYQYQGAWRRAGWASEIREALLRHVDKGDPLDVAAYCAFAWHHGWTLAAPDTTPTSAESALAAERKRCGEFEKALAIISKNGDAYAGNLAAIARAALAGKEPDNG